jgi:hypothetical protein
MTSRSRLVRMRIREGTNMWLVFYMSFLFPMLVVLVIVMDLIVPAESRVFAARHLTRSHKAAERERR